MRQKIITVNFKPVVTPDEGTLFLEKRPKGKWLCFKKGNIIKSLKLTKKSFQNLNRFTAGVRIEKYVEMEYDQDDEGYCDVWYGWHSKNTNLPATITSKPKVKSPFIMQVFVYKP